MVMVISRFLQRPQKAKSQALSQNKIYNYNNWK